MPAGTQPQRPDPPQTLLYYAVPGHREHAAVVLRLGNPAHGRPDDVYATVTLYDPSIPYAVEATADENVGQGLLTVHLTGPREGGAGLNRRGGPGRRTVGEYVTQRGVRERAFVSAVQVWAQVAIEWQQRRLAGFDDPLEQGPPAASMQAAVAAVRAAWADQRREPGTRRRGEKKDELVRQVAEKYKTALAQGVRAPTQAIGHELGYSPAHVARLLSEARSERYGLLGPAPRGKAGELAPPAKTRKARKQP